MTIRHRLGYLAPAVVLGAGALLAPAAVSGEQAPNPATEEQLDAAIATLEPEARDLWPETFAGLWRDSEGALRIAFTAGAEEKVESLAQGFPEPELLDPVRADHSLADLEALQGKMIADRDDAQVGKPSAGVSGGTYDLSIDIERNAVVAIVETRTPEVVNALEEPYGGPVVVEEGLLAEPDSCTSRSSCMPNLRSGIESITDAGYSCSTAFVVVTAAGNENILSAAHCETQDRAHAGQDYGEVIDQQYHGRVDAERHGIRGPNFSWVPAIYVDENQRLRNVTGEGTWAGLVEGDVVCKSGITTGKSCATVRTKYYSPSYVGNGNRFIQTGYCAMSEDSGAGVYRGAEAIGIHSGGSDLSCSDPDDYSLFGHIEYAENALDVNVIKTVEPPF